MDSVHITIMGHTSLTEASVLPYLPSGAMAATRTSSCAQEAHPAAESRPMPSSGVQQSKQRAAAGEARRASDEVADRAMQRYADGDDAAFEVVYDSIAPRVHAYLRRQSRDPNVADDLVQQTFVQIHRHRGSYLRGCSVLPWAFAIARRLYIDELRRRKCDALFGARGVVEGDTLTRESADEALSLRQSAELVDSELSRLPESQRVAFELVRLEGLSHDEAAQVLGTTVSAVKLRAFRAYAAIRQVLGHGPPGPAEPVRTRPL
jgi:RNA polymerase sigma-70 factor, ECF subfamily